MRRFEYVEGTSSKFWSAGVEGNTFVVVYGRIGTPGQRKDKQLPTEAAAQAECQKKIAEKVREGYTEVGGAEAPAPGASASATSKPAAAPSDARPPRPPLPPRLRAATANTNTNAPDPARVQQAVEALAALEAEVGSRSWHVAQRARRARRALAALGGFDPAKSAAMAPVFDALMKLVVAPAGEKRLSLRLALELLRELDAAAFVRALALWKNADPKSPAGPAVRALAAQADALGEPELALRVATLLADRPDRGAGSEAGWAKRWKSVAPHLAAATAERGTKLGDFLRGIDPGADAHLARRLEKMSAGA